MSINQDIRERIDNYKGMLTARQFNWVGIAMNLQFLPFFMPYPRFSRFFRFFDTGGGPPSPPNDGKSPSPSLLRTKSDFLTSVLAI